MNYLIHDINPYVIGAEFVAINKPYSTKVSFGMRKTIWYEIDFICSGGGCIITDDKKYNVQKGDLFFRKPGTITQGFSPFNTYLAIFDLRYDFMRMEQYNMIDSLGIRDIFNADNPNRTGKDFSLTNEFSFFNFPCILQTQRYDKIERLFRNLLQVYDDGKPNRALQLKYILLEILLEAQDEYLSQGNRDVFNRTINKNDDKIMKIKDYINENYSSKLSITDLAQRTELSEAYFCKIFKKVTGYTPVEYINNIKIEKVKTLLIKSDKTIKEISDELHFENHTYLYTLFKKKSGMSPTSFREKEGNRKK